MCNSTQDKDHDDDYQEFFPHKPYPAHINSGTDLVTFDYKSLATSSKSLVSSLVYYKYTSKDLL